MKRPVKIATGTILSFAFSFAFIQSAAANLIYNPGFELAGSLASQSGSSNTTQTIPGWVLFGAGGSAGGTAAGHAKPVFFGSGDNVGYMAGTATISTSAAFRPAVTAGQVFDYSFDIYNASSGTMHSNYGFLRWFDASDELLSSVNLIPNTIEGRLDPGFGRYSGSVTAPANATSVGFSMAATYNPFRTVYIDDFSLTLVPEPSSYAAIIGLAGLSLALLRRRR